MFTMLNPASEESLILPVSRVKFIPNRDEDDPQSQAGIKDGDSQATPACFNTADGTLWQLLGNLRKMY